MTLGSRRGACCWFAGRWEFGPCDGQLERAHWIKQQVLRRELGAACVACSRCGAGPGERCTGPDGPLGGSPGVHKERNLALQEVVWDPRVWSFMCHGHHRALDHARTLRVDRADLPREVEEYAVERDSALRAEPLGAWLDMEYGPIEEAA